MDVAATVTSKGQVTIPKQVREALELQPGDKVLFRILDGRAVLSRTPDLLELAGAVPVPPGKEGAEWKLIREEARRAQVERGREA